jgi:hypothetical protein
MLARWHEGARRCHQGATEWHPKLKSEWHLYLLVVLGLKKLVCIKCHKVPQGATRCHDHSPPSRGTLPSTDSRRAHLRICADAPAICALCADARRLPAHSQRSPLGPGAFSQRSGIPRLTLAVSLRGCYHVRRFAPSPKEGSAMSRTEPASSGQAFRSSQRSRVSTPSRRNNDPSKAVPGGSAACGMLSRSGKDPYLRCRGAFVNLLKHILKRGVSIGFHRNGKSRREKEVILNKKPEYLAWISGRVC